MSSSRAGLDHDASSAQVGALYKYLHRLHTKQTDFQCGRKGRH